MRLNGSRVPYRFPSSNIAIKNAKLNMATKADTDIFAEVFYVQIEPGAGASFRAVVIKPPQVSIEADGDLTPTAGRRRSDWLSLDPTGEQTVDPVRIIYNSQEIKTNLEQNVDPVRMRPSEGIIEITGSQGIVTKALKTFSSAWKTTANQSLISKLIFHVTPTLQAQASQSADGAVIFTGSLSFSGNVDISIVSLIQQLVSTLKYTGDLEPGDLLTINVENKTVKANGANVRHNFEGDFIKLRKGINKLEYWDEESDRNLEITIDYEPRWL